MTAASVANPGFAKGGTDHGERAECEPKWGPGAEWAEPLVGVRAGVKPPSPKLKYLKYS